MSKAEGVAALERLQKLLRAEYEAEKAEFRHESETMGVERKVKRGHCWFPVSLGRSYYNAVNQLVVEVLRSTDEEVEHNFEYGRSVCFFRRDATGGVHYFRFGATVSYAEADRMVVALDNAAQIETLRGTDWVGVQLDFDETTFRLMFQALNTAIGATNGPTARLRRLFHGTLEPIRAEMLPIRLPWLNETQQQAVNAILAARDVAIVHGPPGTGKTTTLVEAVYETLRREEQVLVCAQSNMAVDWLAEKLSERGLSVLRIGNPSRVTDKMLGHCYERQFEAHAEYPKLWAIRREIRALYAQRRKTKSDIRPRIAHLRERATELELTIRQALFDQARVVAATLAGSGHPLLEGRRFHTVFIDEAAQALEPACWIAMNRADRVVMAGDHCQLMPTIKSCEAMAGGLGVTLMEHVAQKHPSCVTLLTTQYRMNRSLMQFSSDWFYHGRVKAAPEVSGRSLLDFDTPMVWIDAGEAQSESDAPAPGGEEFVGGSFGRINRAEARLTIDTLKTYVRRIGLRRFLDERLDVGIISPYRVQVQHLRHLVARDAELRPLRSAISINTVDGFQGQERDVILVSLVRANREGQIGFLSDLRRMNVAMTRARHKLFILGDVKTLTHHRFYRKLYEYACQLQADSLPTDPYERT